MNECPSCDRRDFKNERGLKLHHAKSHGESLTTVEKECANCGTMVTKNTHDIQESENVYCDHGCYSTHKKLPEEKEKVCAECGSKFTAEKTNSNTYKDYCSTDCRYSSRDVPSFSQEANKVDCDNCGVEFERLPSRVRTQNFCSMECMSEFRTGKNQGEDNPAYKGKIEKECEECGQAYQVRPSTEDDRVHCSKECHNKSMRTKGSAFFADRLAYSVAPNWREQREKRLKKDGYECVACGMSEEKHQTKYQQGLHVHHVRPRKEFFDGERYDYKEANKIENLLTLCRRCHHRWEGIPLKPQT